MVTEIISTKYNLDLIAGKSNQQCPFCEKSTFSIKPDNLFGKCFHPLCNKTISNNENDGSAVSDLSSILQSIYIDCKSALLSKQNRYSKEAKTYLMDSRKLSERVITKAMIGIVPQNYDVENKFKNVLDLYKTNIEEIKNGDNAKELERYNKLHTSMIEYRDDLIKKFNSSTGYLMFFYVNEYSQIISIRFRKPNTKKFKQYKPLSESGVFAINYEEFNIEELLIVVEGEFNLLQYENLCEKIYSDDTIKRLPRAIAVGSVSSADIKTIAKICHYPCVIFDNDLGGAGFNLVTNFQNLLHLEAFTTPENDSDLDKFILSFGNDSLKAYQCLMELYDNRKRYFRDYKAIIEEIFKIRSENKNNVKTNDKVIKIITFDLRHRCIFYHDNNCEFIFNKENKKLIFVNYENKVSTDFNNFMFKYGINNQEKIFSIITAAIINIIKEEGTHVNIHNTTHYETSTNTLYVSNNNNGIIRITANQIDVIDNGTDGILFMTDPMKESIDLISINDDKSYLDDLLISKMNFGDNILDPGELRIIFLFWLLSIFFHTMLSTKMILLITGEKGSGKSVILKLIGKLLFGKYYNVHCMTGNERDFNSLSINTLYVGLDNVDSKCEWFKDKLATSATGAKVVERTLFTNYGTTEFIQNCFIAISSRTPYFGRDDVADRLFIIKLKRFTTFDSEKKIIDNLLDNRNRIMSEIINHLQQIIQILHNHKEYISSNNFRNADFYNFIIKIAKEYGIKEQFDSILDKIVKQQSVFTLESDSLLQLLQLWMKNPENHNRFLTNNDFMKELSSISTQHNIKFYYENVKSFAQRMLHIRSNLESFYNYDSKKIKGERFFRISPKNNENLDIEGGKGGKGFQDLVEHQ